MILKSKGKKVGVIPDDFKCPCVGKVYGALVWEECSVFGFTGWFCPYAAFAHLEERRLNRDCCFAPAEIWRSFRNYEERVSIWVFENKGAENDG